MIVTCKQCAASFQLDDQIIKPNGTRVKCSKCSSVFDVYPVASSAADVNNIESTSLPGATNFDFEALEEEIESIESALLKDVPKNAPVPSLQPRLADELEAAGLDDQDLKTLFDPTESLVDDSAASDGYDDDPLDMSDIDDLLESDVDPFSDDDMQADSFLAAENRDSDESNQELLEIEALMLNLEADEDPAVTPMQAIEPQPEDDLQTDDLILEIDDDPIAPPVLTDESVLADAQPEDVVDGFDDLVLEIDDEPDLPSEPPDTSDKIDTTPDNFDTEFDDLMLEIDDGPTAPPAPPDQHAKTDPDSQDSDPEAEELRLEVDTQSDPPPALSDETATADAQSKDEIDELDDLRLEIDDAPDLSPPSPDANVKTDVDSEDIDTEFDDLMLDVDDQADSPPPPPDIKAATADGELETDPEIEELMLEVDDDSSEESDDSLSTIDASAQESEFADQLAGLEQSFDEEAQFTESQTEDFLSDQPQAVKPAGSSPALDIPDKTGPPVEPEFDRQTEVIDSGDLEQIYDMDDHTDIGGAMQTITAAKADEPTAQPSLSAPPPLNREAKAQDLPAPASEDDIPSHTESEPPAPKRSQKYLIILLIVVLLAAAGYFAVTYAPKLGLKLPFVSGAGQPESKEPGNLKIDIVSVSGEFIQNQSEGYLFVISGKIKNDYTTPRGFVSVQGKIFLKGGQAAKPFSEKTAFCGNELTEEQLKTLKIDQIYKHLANRSGLRRTNAHIKPGATLAFMIVFPIKTDQLQKLDNYTVEVVKSSPV